MRGGRVFREPCPRLLTSRPAGLRQGTAALVGMGPILLRTPPLEAANEINTFREVLKQLLDDVHACCAESADSGFVETAVNRHASGG